MERRSSFVLFEFVLFCESSFFSKSNEHKQKTLLNTRPNLSRSRPDRRLRKLTERIRPSDDQVSTESKSERSHSSFVYKLELYHSMNDRASRRRGLLARELLGGAETTH